MLTTVNVFSRVKHASMTSRKWAQLCDGLLRAAVASKANVGLCSVSAVWHSRRTWKAMLQEYDLEGARGSDKDWSDEQHEHVCPDI